MRRLAERRGGSNVQVFGSRGRGDIVASSDLDLLVDMKNGSSLLDMVGLKNDLEEDLGLQVDVVTEASLSSHFGERVLGEAEAL